MKRYAMAPLRALALALGLLALPGGQGFAQSAPTTPTPASTNDGMSDRKAERERIRHAREAYKAQRLQDETACYQRFAAQDCLQAVRSQARDAEARLRAREIELNDAERREKAAARSESIAEKQRAAASEASPTSLVPQAQLRKPPASRPAEAVQAQREHGAAMRAQQQRERAQKQSQEHATQAAQSAEKAAQARARHAQTLQAAEERRARVEKAQQGRRPVAPLPDRAAGQ